MRLADIPEDKLEQIKKFIDENRRKYPVTSMQGGIEKVKTLPEVIKEKFGVELSPSQVYELSRGYKTVKVKLTVDTIRNLEEQYGSVEQGLRALAKQAASINAPEYLKPAIRKLAGMGAINYTKAIVTIADLGYSDPDDILKQLFRLGFGTNDRGLFKFSTVATPWYASLFGIEQSK